MSGDHAHGLFQELLIGRNDIGRIDFKGYDIMLVPAFLLRLNRFADI